MRLTKELVREWLEYDETDGRLYWKKKPGITSNYAPGMRFGRVDNCRGSRRGHFLGRDFYEHQLVFLYHHGFLTSRVIHADGNKLNNKVTNLTATGAQIEIEWNKRKSSSSRVCIRELKETFEYNSHAKGLLWKNPPVDHEFLRGKRAGYTRRNGTRLIQFHGKQYKEEVLVYLYFYGRIPKYKCVPKRVCHKNGIVDDNRIQNLILCHDE